MLLYLTNIGGILARSFRFVYGRFCLCGNRRKAALAATRSRSIRMQRQRSIAATPPTPARSPSTSRLKALVSKSPTTLQISKSNTSSGADNQPAGQDSSANISQKQQQQQPVKPSGESTQAFQQLSSEASR